MEGPSSSFAPYFDATLNEEQKSMLEEVPTASLITDRVSALRLKNTFSSLNPDKK